MSFYHDQETKKVRSICLQFTIQFKSILDLSTMEHKPHNILSHSAAISAAWSATRTRPSSSARGPTSPPGTTRSSHLQLLRLLRPSTTKSTSLTKDSCPRAPAPYPWTRPRRRTSLSPWISRRLRARGRTW